MNVNPAFNSNAAYSAYLEPNISQISSDVMLSCRLFAVKPVRMSVDCEVIEEVIANSSLSISLHKESWGQYLRWDLMQQYYVVIFS